MTKDATTSEPATTLQERARRVIDAGGGCVKLADRLGDCRPSAVSNWLKTGIPPARVPAVSAITGIAMADIRPDLYRPGQG